MYAITPLDPSSALRFEALAPFEMRDVLRGLASLPRVHAFGAQLIGRPIGLVMVVRDGAGTQRTGRLLALTVARAYRRIGVGRALFAAACDELAAQGVERISCAYAFDSADGLRAAEAFFAATAWEPPETTMVHCSADESFLASPLLRELAPLPPEYAVCDWIDVTPAERESIRVRQRAEPWYPPELDPFHFEPEMEIVNSLALRYRGEVVGWLLTTRTSSQTMYYRCLFVRDDLARLGRGLTLLTEAIRRHWDAIGRKPGAGEWSTPTSLPRMIRFIKRHLQPYGARVREQRRVQKTLTATPAAPRVQTRGAARPTSASVRRIACLSAAESALARAAVLDARPAWRRHTHESLPFHTLGACAQLDAIADIGAYETLARAQNAALSARLPWLYDRVRAALTGALGAPVVFDHQWALPGFRIDTPQRGSSLPLAPVHCDIQHFLLEPGATYTAPPMSFALCVTSPEDASGLTEWSLAFADTVGCDSEETARLLDAAEQNRYAFAPGELLVHEAERFHQRLPFRDASVRGEMITLEGHARVVNGTWRVYW